MTRNKELNVLVRSDSSPDAGLELVTFVAADSVGCCRHLHLALAIHRWRSRCIRRMILIVALVPQFTEVNSSGFYLYHPKVLDAQVDMWYSQIFDDHHPCPLPAPVDL